MSVNVTEKAANEVKRVLVEQKMSPETHALRVAVAGGGCSGFSYSLGFVTKSEIDTLNDSQFTVGDLTYVVDRKSELYLEGTTVDFYDGIERRGFTFDNPAAKRSCGCGNSFST